MERLGVVGRSNALSWPHWWLFGWASLELLTAWTLVRLAPFRRVARHLGRAGAVAANPSDGGGSVAAAEISWAVRAVTRRIPVRFTCLMQAVAAQRMLRKRRVPATVFLAMVADIPADEPLSAHAWVRCGDRVVVGACDESRYRVIATFA